MIRNWYAVYTKPQQEQKVAAALAKKKIDSYCPLARVSGYTGFGKKINWQPLFSSFVFVHITEAQFTTVRQANDVINFMYWLGRPAVIPAAEIESIRQFTQTYQNLKVEKTAIIKNTLVPAFSEQPGEPSVIIKGIRQYKIRVSLPSLGYQLIAQAERPASIFDYPLEKNIALS